MHVWCLAPICTDTKKSTRTMHHATTAPRYHSGSKLSGSVAACCPGGAVVVAGGGAGAHRQRAAASLLVGNGRNDGTLRCVAFLLGLGSGSW